MCVSLLERPGILGDDLSCHWWSVQGCMLTEHRQQTAEEEPHTLLLGGAALPSHVSVFSVLTARGPPMTAAAKGYRRKVPGSNTEQKALLKYKKHLGSFQNIDPVGFVFS